MRDPALAVLAAAHHRRLRGFGNTVRKTIDLIIGTLRIARGHALLTADRDFEPMDRHLGLTLLRSSRIEEDHPSSDQFPCFFA